MSNPAKVRIIIALLAGALLAHPSNRARADEISYLPDGTSMFMSGKFQDFLKSKVSAEFKNMLNLKGRNPDDADFEKGISEELGVPVSNIARISMGMAFREKGGENIVGMLTTIKPVTAASIIAGKKDRFKFRKNLTHKEIKVGKHTVYEESYQYEIKGNDKGDKLSEVQRGEAFCIVEDNIVLFGRLHGYQFNPKEEPQKGELYRVLERKGPARLSANMQAGLKRAALTNSGIIVLDFQTWPTRERERFLRTFGLESLKDSVEKLDTLTVTINEKDKVTAKVILTCQDAATAAEVKKSADARLSNLKDMVKKLAAKEGPKEEQILVQAAQEGLAAIKLTVNGNQATAEASVPAATAVRFLFGYFYVSEAQRPPKKESKK